MKNCLRRSPNYLLLTILGTFIFTFADNTSFILLYSNAFSYVFYCVIRQNEQLSKYGDTKSARNIMLIELKKLIEANPLFRDKLTFPAFKASRLRTLINQRLFSTNLLLLFFSSNTCCFPPNLVFVFLLSSLLLVLTSWG